MTPDLTDLRAAWWAGTGPRLVFIHRRRVLGKDYWLQVPSSLWDVSSARVWEVA